MRYRDLYKLLPLNNFLLNKINLLITVVISVSAITASVYLWSIGFYLFFLPIVFLPFLKFVRTHSQKIRMCPMCELPSEGNYCNRCGIKLL